MVFGDKRLYTASQISKLENAQALGSITLKTDLPYENKPGALLAMSCYAELRELGVVSPSILDATLTALLELEEITEELDLPLYQEDTSGIIWALKEAREGSVLNEYIAYAFQLAGDDNVKTYIESGLYDIGKMAFGAVVISLPKFVSEKIIERRQRANENNAEKEQIERSPNVVDFRLNTKSKAKWKHMEP